MSALPLSGKDIFSLNPLDKAHFRCYTSDSTERSETMEEKQKQAFIESWGTMGSMWGLNSSTARVHALLIAQDGAISLDDIAKSLKISRGNASMCLKELRNWGVIKKVKKTGDRRDYYQTEPDIWKMFFAIARQRKLREFDPLLDALRQALSPARKDSKSSADKRLRQMEEFLTTLDKIAQNLLENEDSARSAMTLLARS